MRRICLLPGLLLLAAACGTGPDAERDVTLRATISGEVVHGSGVIEIDPNTYVSTLRAGLSLGEGETATLVIRGSIAPRIERYEVRRGQTVRFVATQFHDEDIRGDLDRARTGDRILFSFDAEDTTTGEHRFVEGSAMVTVVRGYVEPAITVEEPTYVEDEEPLVLGCDGPESDPAPAPDSDWNDDDEPIVEIEGDVYDDTDDSEVTIEGDTWTDDSWSDDSDDDSWSDDDVDDDEYASGCEGDTVEFASNKRSRRRMRYAFVFCWPILLIGAANRTARRRLR